MPKPLIHGMRLCLATLLTIVFASGIEARSFEVNQGYIQSGLVDELFITYNKSEANEFFYKRRKKQKTSKKMKRHNRSMGKKFQKKNNDSIQDKLQ